MTDPTPITDACARITARWHNKKDRFAAVTDELLYLYGVGYRDGAAGKPRRYVRPRRAR